MNSATKNPTRRTLYLVVPFVAVLSLSTFVLGNQTHTSFPITITSSIQTPSGNYRLEDVARNVSGTIDWFYPVPDGAGCLVRLSGDDETIICITSLYSASAETNRNARPTGSDPTRMVGTGRILIPVDGVLRQGPVYIDVKGTWEWDSSKETLLFNGKIGGGGPDFVFKGSFKTTFVYPLE